MLSYEQEYQHEVEQYAQYHGIELPGMVIQVAEYKGDEGCIEDKS